MLNAINDDSWTVEKNELIFSYACSCLSFHPKYMILDFKTCNVDFEYVDFEYVFVISTHTVGW